MSKQPYHRMEDPPQKDLTQKEEPVVIQYRSFRIVGLIFCLGFAVAGAGMTAEKDHNARFRIACALLCILILLISLSGLLVSVLVVISTAFVLELSGGFVYHAKYTNQGTQYVAGYALLILTMWLGFILIAPLSLGSKISKMFSSALNILASILFALNFLGCILLWSAKESGVLPLSITAFLNGFLFLATYLISPKEAWICIFYFSYFQKWLLSLAIDHCSTACEIGSILSWIAHLIWVIIFVWNVIGGLEGNPQLNTPIDSYKQVKWVLIGLFVACIVLAIIGGIVLDGRKKFSVSCVVFSIFFYFLTVFQKGDVRQAFFIIATALLFSTSGEFMESERAYHSYIHPLNSEHERYSTGIILMLSAMWFSFFLSSSTLIESFVSKFRMLFSSPLFLIALLSFILNWLGCILWWRYVDANKTAYSVGLSVTILWNGFFFFFAIILLVGRRSTWACLFFSAMIGIQVGGLMIDVTGNEKTTGQVGFILCYIAQIMFILICFFEIRGISHIKSSSSPSS